MSSRMRRTSPSPLQKLHVLMTREKVTPSSRCCFELKDGKTVDIEISEDGRDSSSRGSDSAPLSPQRSPHRFARQTARGPRGLEATFDASQTAARTATHTAAQTAARTAAQTAARTVKQTAARTATQTAAQTEKQTAARTEARTAARTAARAVTQRTEESATRRDPKPIFDEVPPFIIEYEADPPEPSYLDRLAMVFCGCGADYQGDLGTCWRVDQQQDFVLYRGGYSPSSPIEVPAGLDDSKIII